VSELDPRLVEATRELLARRPAGAARVGWKYGSGEREQLGGDHVVGCLTSATLLEDGGTYRGGGEKLQADVEVAVEVGDEGEPERYGVALEICDVAGDLTVEELVVANDYHRAVAFGRFSDARPDGVEGALAVNGERRAAGLSSGEVDARVAAVDRVLRAAGERLEPGDRVITGLIVNTRLEPGDDVTAELDGLGRVGLRIA
jgi:hypothetical protein